MIRIQAIRNSKADILKLNVENGGSATKDSDLQDRE